MPARQRLLRIHRTYSFGRKAVNQWGAAFDAFGIWLPKTDTDPNSRMENSAGAIFSIVLTKTKVSEMRSFVRESRLAEHSVLNGSPNATLFITENREFRRRIRLLLRILARRPIRGQQRR